MGNCTDFFGVRHYSLSMLRVPCALYVSAVAGLSLRALRLRVSARSAWNARCTGLGRVGAVFGGFKI
jgi:hypothetical protein